MESSAATQLPEVDSLPDGFVERLAESVANGSEKPLDVRKGNTLLKSDILNDTSNVASAHEIPEGQDALSEKHNCASRESAGSSDDGCMEQREDNLAIRPESSTSASKASPGSETGTISDKGTRGSDGKANHGKEAQTSENQKSQKGCSLTS